MPFKDVSDGKIRRMPWTAFLFSMDTEKISLELE